MKKIVVCLLTICMMITQINVFASEEDFSLKINRLIDYGVVYGDINGNLRLDDSATRAEATTFVCRLLNIKSDSNECKFIDVPKDSWAAGYITAAYQNGLVEGCGDKVFKPEKKVLQSEVVKMIITGLGYAPKAKEQGNYPDGYTTIAQEIGLLNDIIPISNGNVTRKDILNMVYTAIDIPIMQQTVFGANSEYTVMDGSNNTPLITLRKVLGIKE